MQITLLPTVPRLTPVPLRASARRWLASAHEDRAWELREEADSKREIGARQTDDYWRALFLSTADDCEARAVVHDRAAARWREWGVWPAIGEWMVGERAEWPS